QSAACRRGCPTQRLVRPVDQHRRTHPETARFCAALSDAVPKGDQRGLARQESRFVADIMSSAGAVGLMQLMPATARWVARQIGRADYRVSSLDQPELNAQMGN